MAEADVRVARRTVLRAGIFASMPKADDPAAGAAGPAAANALAGGGGAGGTGAAAAEAAIGIEEEEEEARLEWTERESDRPLQASIWRGYRARCRAERECPRELGRAEAVRLVREVFEAKANADAASLEGGGGGVAAGFATMERTFFRFLEEKYGSREAADLAAYDVLRAVDAHRDGVRLLQLFARAMGGGWYDADWKYILRAQQFARAAAPGGFAGLGAVEDFLRTHFYRDLPPSELERFVTGLAGFPAYSGQIAVGGGGGGGRGRVSPETFGEFVAYLLQAREEPRFRKVEIVLAATGGAAGGASGGPAGAALAAADAAGLQPVPYDRFEALADMCSPLERGSAAACRLYFRMLARAYPDLRFPARSLVTAVAACELETLMLHHSCDLALRLEVPE
jgi:hypothetical protein